MTDFLGVETLPLLAIEALCHRDNRLGAQEVDEGVAHIALVLEVDWQIEEVISAPEILVDGGQQHLLGILVGYVF